MKVIEMLNEQINKVGKDTPAASIGFFLLELCQSSPSTAQLVEQDLANESMSISRCYQKLYDHATKNKKGNVYVMPPQEAEGIIRQFYGIPTGKQAEAAGYTTAVLNNVISLDDLLGGL